MNLKPSTDPSNHIELNSRPNGNDYIQANEDKQDDEEHLENGIDGRITPTADSRSNPSRASSSASNQPSPNSTTMSLESQLTSSSNPPNPSYTPTNGHANTEAAEAGFGSAQAEEQLKNALKSKDRIFLLKLSKEFEAFINRLVLNKGQISSNAENGTNQTPTTSTSLMASISYSATIRVPITSNFQKMLVYKTAEWYGLKAVSGQEGGMVIGVIGNFNDKSSSLILSDLVPTVHSAEGQTQRFQIMRRAPNRGEGSGSSSPAEGSTSSGGPRLRTMEEREAEYAAAKGRIYGKSIDTDEVNGQGSAETSQVIESGIEAADDEIDPIPRHLYPTTDVIYPSLSHSPRPDSNVPPPITTPIPGMSNQYLSTSSGQYSYQSSWPPYREQVDSNRYPISQRFSGVQSMQPQQPQPGYGMMPPGYMDVGQNGYYMSGLPQQNGYAAPGGWIPSPSNNGYPAQISPVQQSYGMQQQNGMNGPPQQWAYPQQPQPVPMPMIPQGAPYAYPPAPPPQQFQPMLPAPMPQYRQGSHPQLVQPTPLRPAIQPHSSASSSISSRSYQDGSRPHSRGSTTSTRSAASSVRLGAMYPASQGPGYRQRAMKSQGVNGMTTLGGPNGGGLGMGNGSESRKNTRGHSPSSATTASSRSSRRTSSIPLSIPTSSQHQLPQRPDWAANNVPYHPSPLPVPGTAGLNGYVNGPPSAVEFPPLLRQGQGTNAEPMQVERVKIKPSSGSVWNGTTVNIKPTTHLHNGSTGNEQKISILPGPSRTPAPVPASAPPPQQQEMVDPDFPRRLPSKTQAVLYDPSANSHSRPSSVNTNKSITSNSNSNIALSAEEIIEARLAQISLDNGIYIGSAPNSRDGAGPGKSYAKVLRRD
nr:uncharacterized protein I206_04411 [Kwoniella pini CBS 10737]OCF49883.1 hypothetical protein I206_04411 [Kwoniella pini CBS 10737]